MMAKTKRAGEGKTMSIRLLAVIGALVLVSCTGTETPPYELSSFYGRPGGMPTFWISYPTEGDDLICLDADHTFPVYWVMYQAPAAARVRFKLDRHLPSGGTVVGPVGCSGLTCLATASPFRINMTGQAVGSHLLEGEIVNSDGLALTNKVPCGNTLQPGDCPIQSHKFFVNFSTMLRSAESEDCPLPE